MLMMLDDGQYVNKNAIKFIEDYREPDIGDLTTLGRVPPKFLSTIHFIDATVLHTTSDPEELGDLFGLGVPHATDIMGQLSTTLTAIADELASVSGTLRNMHEAEHGSMS